MRYDISRSILYTFGKGERMNEDKIHLVNKLFNNETIRTVWDKEKEK